MNLLLSLLACLLLLASSNVSALYDSKSGVVQLTTSNFAKLVTDPSAGVVLVEFYAPWCGHCKSAAPEVAKAASALKGVAIVGAVDMTVHEALGKPFGIQGFPTFKIFVGGKPTDYNGPRTASAMVDAVTAAVSKAAKAKLNGGGGGGKQQQQQQKSKSSGSSGSNSGGRVIDLTDSDFDSKISAEDEMFMVSFTAPWCGHCKSLHPEWEQAAKKLDGTGVTLFNVDATANEGLARRFQIKGFPTIKTFRVGKSRSDDSKAEDYQGPREAGGIVEFALNTFEADGGQAKSGSLVQELVTQDLFEETCVGKKKCVIAFLDHLLDTKAKNRKAQIELLTSVAKKARHVPMLWVSANDQVEFEETYDLRSGFPAVIMLRVGPNNEKLTWVHKGKFTEDALSSFVSSPRGLSTAIQKPWPTIKKTHPWDGESEAVKPRAQEDDGFNLEEFLASS